MFRNQPGSTRPRAGRLAAAGLAAIAVLGLAACVEEPAGPPAAPVKVFDSSPEPMALSYVSQAYQATQTEEFGDVVSLAPGARKLTSAEVTMVTWAYRSNWLAGPFCATEGNCTTEGWKHPITFNVYAVDNSGSIPALGAKLGTATTTVTIPWRPEPTPGLCGEGATTWAAGDGVCRNGFSAEVTIDLSAAGITATDSIVYGIEYNTGTYGNTPLGIDGPFNQLNIALDPAAPTVGIDQDPGAFFQSTVTAGWYYDNGALGTGTFRHNTAAIARSPLVELFATA